MRWRECTTTEQTPPKAFVLLNYAHPMGLLVAYFTELPVTAKMFNRYDVRIADIRIHL